jgi:FKBP-type peptidyl-prolyl cis-trans isomerase FkpA
MRLRSLFAVLLPLTFAACLGGTDSITYPNIAIENTTFATSLNVNLAASTKTANGVYYRDVTPGTGATLTTGQTATVSYKGQLANGVTFDQSTTANPTFDFVVGGNQVIPGFEQGMVGMKVGGVRQLVIPPALGYGTANDPIIPPNSVLVFNVTLVSVK